MRILGIILLTFHLISSDVSGQNRSFEEEIGVKFLKLPEYTKGMRFFFPSMPSVEARRLNYEFYRLSSRSLDTKYGLVVLGDLWGKTLIIDSVLVPVRNMAFHNGLYKVYSFIMEDQDAKQYYLYTTTVRDDVTSIEPEALTLSDNVFIRGAVNVELLEVCRKALTGQLFFTLFPIKGRRYERVKITKVDIGTWETPIRVHIVNEIAIDSIIDVSFLGTNIVGAYSDRFNFKKYFSVQDIRGETPDSIWKNVQIGKLQLGMSPGNVRLILGKPSQVKVVVNSGKEMITYFYPQYQITFLGNQVSSIEHIAKM